MQKYENKRKLWYGWRQEAAEHFSVEPVTIDLWYKKLKHELFDWLENEIEKRKNDLIKAESIKKEIESPA